MVQETLTFTPLYGQCAAAKKGKYFRRMVHAGFTAALELLPAIFAAGLLVFCLLQLLSQHTMSTDMSTVQNQWGYTFDF